MAAARRRVGPPGQDEAELHDHRHRALGFAGVVSVSWMSTVIGGYDGVIDVADELLRDDRHVADHLACSVAVTSHFTFGVSFGTRP